MEQVEVPDWYTQGQLPPLPEKQTFEPAPMSAAGGEHAADDGLPMTQYTPNSHSQPQVSLMLCALEAGFHTSSCPWPWHTIPWQPGAVLPTHHAVQRL